MRLWWLQLRVNATVTQWRPVVVSEKGGAVVSDDGVGPETGELIEVYAIRRRAGCSGPRLSHPNSFTYSTCVVRSRTLHMHIVIQKMLEYSVSLQRPCSM
jgi:hypothetical protein